ncbi:protocatechuate 3,4-dioxygenase subunit beta, partial [Pseudomonas sp. ATCC 13867]
MSDAENSRFVIRDRNWHPKAFTPDYQDLHSPAPRVQA